MKTKLYLTLTALTVMVGLVSACSAVARHHAAFFNGESSHPSSVTADDKDPITGEWNVMFLVQGHNTPATFSFKLDGQKVTGTAYSDHTGAGTIRDGKWIDGKLSFTLDFAKHESIVVNGTVKDGKLAGEFTTEGFTAKWEATRK